MSDVSEMTSWGDGLRLFLAYLECYCIATGEDRDADGDMLEGWRPAQNQSGSAKSWMGWGWQSPPNMSRVGSPGGSLVCLELQPCQ